MSNFPGVSAATGLPVVKTSNNLPSMSCGCPINCTGTYVPNSTTSVTLVLSGITSCACVSLGFGVYISAPNINGTYTVPWSNSAPQISYYPPSLSAIPLYSDAACTMLDVRTGSIQFFGEVISSSPCDFFQLAMQVFVGGTGAHGNSFVANVNVFSTLFSYKLCTPAVFSNQQTNCPSAGTVSYGGTITLT